MIPMKSANEVGSGEGVIPKGKAISFLQLVFQPADGRGPDRVVELFAFVDEYLSRLGIRIDGWSSISN